MRLVFLIPFESSKLVNFMSSNDCIETKKYTRKFQIICNGKVIKWLKDVIAVLFLGFLLQ